MLLRRLLRTLEDSIHCCRMNDPNQTTFDELSLSAFQDKEVSHLDKCGLL